MYTIRKKCRETTTITRKTWDIFSFKFAAFFPSRSCFFLHLFYFKIATNVNSYSTSVFFRAVSAPGFNFKFNNSVIYDMEMIAYKRDHEYNKTNLKRFKWNKNWFGYLIIDGSWKLQLKRFNSNNNKTFLVVRFYILD